MPLKDQLEREGLWLFRWRSFLPLIAMPLLAVAVVGMKWPFGDHAVHNIWDAFCLGVSLVGLGIRVATVGFVPEGTSGRNTKQQSAAVLNTTGMYSIVRHPLYVGNFLIGLGVFLSPAQWWLPLVYTLLYWLYYERIMLAEEAFLSERFGASFLEWARATPAFVPRVSQWRSTDASFSIRSVLRREYTSVFLIIVMHYAVEECEHLSIDHHFVYEPYWTALLLGGTFIYFALRSLKKRTTLLDVPGR